MVFSPGGQIMVAHYFNVNKQLITVDEKNIAAHKKSPAR
jgi:hypothetical protein